MTESAPQDDPNRVEAGQGDPKADDSEPRPGALADPAWGNTYGPPELIPAWVRFFIAGAWTVGVFWACGFVYPMFSGAGLAPDLLFRLLALILTASGFAFFLRVLDYDQRPLLAALGLPMDAASRRQLGAGLVIGVLMISADVAAIALVGSVRFHIHLSTQTALAAAGGATLLFAGAALEELSFRGYPFQKLVESLGPFWGVAVLSVLFGMVHLDNPDAGGWLSWGFFNTLAVGALLAVARLRSGSLWCSIGLHFGWNFFEGTVYGLPVSGIVEFRTLVRGSTKGPLWATGGAYGPEASAICMMALLAGLPLLLWWTRSQSRADVANALNETRG